jgi:hypothetical protein
MQSLHFMPASNQHSTNNMYSPILPLELCELVIDLIDNQDALHASSLACKAFLPSCRRHLFYHIRLYSRRIAERFFHSISSMPSPISPYRHIRHLRLREEQRYERQWVNNALPLLATLDVIILELDCVKWSQLDQTGQASLLSGFQKVKRLETSYGSFDTSEQMSQFIGSFPLLAELSCSQTNWTDNAPTALLISLPHSLHTITLAACQSRLFHQLLTLESPPHVRSVSFQHMDSKYMESVSMFLEALGSNLEELDLGDVPYALRGQHQRPEEGQPCCHLLGNFHVISSSYISVVLRINLAHNTHLRYIHVKILGIYGSGSMKWLTALFSQVLSPHVVHISLSFQLADISTLGVVDWAEIEREFTRPRWTNLQKLSLSWHGPCEIISPAMEAIMTHLPLLESRGVLGFFPQFNLNAAV